MVSRGPGEQSLSLYHCVGEEYCTEMSLSQVHCTMWRPGESLLYCFTIDVVREAARGAKHRVLKTEIGMPAGLSHHRRMLMSVIGQIGRRACAAGVTQAKCRPAITELPMECNII